MPARYRCCLQQRFCFSIEIHMSYHCIHNRWPVVLKLLMVLAIGCEAAAANPVEAPYQIQPGDVLQVSVWKEPDLQQEVLVRPDGGISFPLAGDLSVSGLSVAQVADAIAEQIKRYIPEPVVTVVTKLIGGNKVYVVGKVNRPGEFQFNRPLDVMQALSMAGGTTPFASLADIRILRRDGTKQSAVRFDYTDIENGKALDKNILLRSGDTVVVP
jgi:polysaccharide export outer membrane protein